MIRWRLFPLLSSNQPHSESFFFVTYNSNQKKMFHSVRLLSHREQTARWKIVQWAPWVVKIFGGRMYLTTGVEEGILVWLNPGNRQCKRGNCALMVALSLSSIMNRLLMADCACQFTILWSLTTYNKITAREIGIIIIRANALRANPLRTLAYSRRKAKVLSTMWECHRGSHSEEW